MYNTNESAVMLYWASVYYLAEYKAVEWAKSLRQWKVLVLFIRFIFVLMLLFKTIEAEYEKPTLSCS